MRPWTDRKNFPPGIAAACALLLATAPGPLPAQPAAAEIPSATDLLTRAGGAFRALPGYVVRGTKVDRKSVV